MKLYKYVSEGKYEPVIEIPENPTNGDMIKAMFPNLKVEENVEFEPNFVKIHPYNDDCFIYFTKELWNSPYMRGE